MTELLFQKCFRNDKGEKIYHFAAITNVDTVNKGIESCHQRFDGDVMVNIIAESFSASKHALFGLIQNYWKEVVNENSKVLETVSFNKREAFIEKHCMEKIRYNLIDYCVQIATRMGL